MSKSALFVCLGNICRSPAAEGVARTLNDQYQIFDLIDSAGTSAYHVGEPPHGTMQKVALDKGHSLQGQKSRQVQRLDFEKFDYIVAMDTSNLMDLEAIQPQNSKAKLVTLLEFAPELGRDVPDPYYGGPDGFVSCFNIVEGGMKAFFEQVSKS